MDEVLPVVVIPPGFLVKVHVPDGKPLNSTVPVDTLQSGCVMPPTVGIDGVVRGAAIPLPSMLVQPLTVLVMV